MTILETHPWTNAFVLLLEIKVTNARQLLTPESNPILSHAVTQDFEALLLMLVVGSTSDSETAGSILQNRLPWQRKWYHVTLMSYVHSMTNILQQSAIKI